MLIDLLLDMTNRDYILRALSSSNSASSSKGISQMITGER